MITTCSHGHARVLSASGRLWCPPCSAERTRRSRARRRGEAPAGSPPDRMPPRPPPSPSAPSPEPPEPLDALGIVRAELRRAPAPAGDPVRLWLQLQRELDEVGSPCRRSPVPAAWEYDSAASRRLAGEAAALCLRCPVLAACLAYALAADERFGVWGALTPDERRGLALEDVAS